MISIFSFVVLVSFLWFLFPPLIVKLFTHVAPAPTGGLFGSAPGNSVSPLIFSCTLLFVILCSLPYCLFSLAPAFGQPAPAPAFGASPAPATGGFFGSTPGRIFT